MRLHTWNYSPTAGKKELIFSLAFDEDSVDLLDKLGVPFFKVPSGEITNKPYLQHIAVKGKPVILSTVWLLWVKLGPPLRC